MLMLEMFLSQYLVIRVLFLAFSERCYCPTRPEGSEPLLDSGHFLSQWNQSDT